MEEFSTLPRTIKEKLNLLLEEEGGNYQLYNLTIKSYSLPSFEPKPLSLFDVSPRLVNLSEFVNLDLVALQVQGFLPFQTVDSPAALIRGENMGDMMDWWLDKDCSTIRTTTPVALAPSDLSETVSLSVRFLENGILVKKTE